MAFINMVKNRLTPTFDCFCDYCGHIYKTNQRPSIVCPKCNMSFYVNYRQLTAKEQSND